MIKKDVLEPVDPARLPAALREFLGDDTDVPAVRSVRQRGHAFATAYLLAGDGGPTLVCGGDNRATFGRARSTVLTVTGHECSPSDLADILSNMAEAIRAGIRHATTEAA